MTSCTIAIVSLLAICSDSLAAPEAPEALEAPGARLLRGLSYMRSQGLLHRAPMLQRHQDVVERDRRAAVDVVAERCGQRIENRAGAGRHRRLADAARAHGRLGIGEVHG